MGPSLRNGMVEVQIVSAVKMSHLPVRELDA
jgi:hypothetical protein